MFKVSWATIIVPGLVGPKPRARAVGNGQPVIIRVPFQRRLPRTLVVRGYQEGVTECGKSSFVKSRV